MRHRCMKRSWHFSTGKSARPGRPARLHRSAAGVLPAGTDRVTKRSGRSPTRVPCRSIARITGLLAGCLLAFTLVPCPADEIPLADFARHAQYEDVKISPDGDHLAATALINGKHVLA